VTWTLALVTATAPAAPEIVEPAAAMLPEVVAGAVRAGWPARALAPARRG
jgi:hypothetical protein